MTFTINKKEVLVISSGDPCFFMEYSSAKFSYDSNIYILVMYILKYCFVGTEF